MGESRYQAAAQAYADGVRVLFTPSGAPTGERGGRGPASPGELAEQAEALAPVSAELTQASTARLADDDAAVRAQAATQLLAKALTDLEVSARLLQAAEDQEDEIAWAAGWGVERGGAGLGATEERLRLILGQAETKVERGRTVPLNVATARGMLAGVIADALDLIPDRAARTGQAALGGLLGLGVAEVARAAGVVGMNLADALGQAEKVTRLYSLFRDFLLKAYDALVGLVGESLAGTAAQKVVEWLEDLREGEQIGELLERLYETERTSQALSQLVGQSGAAPEKFAAAIERLDELGAAYGRQMDLSDHLVRGLKFLSFVPAAALPQGRLVMAAAYMLLGAYVVWSGGDYVDARRLERLNRVPGVQRVVLEELGQ